MIRHTSVLKTHIRKYSHKLIPIFPFPYKTTKRNCVFDSAHAITE